jgi:ribosomal protein L4
MVQDGARRHVLRGVGRVLFPLIDWKKNMKKLNEKERRTSRRSWRSSSTAEGRLAIADNLFQDPC